MERRPGLLTLLKPVCALVSMLKADRPKRLPSTIKHVPAPRIVILTAARQAGEAAYSSPAPLILRS